MTLASPKDLAVVIPTRNRPDELQGLLECLAGQTVPPGGITIVDSSDRERKAQIRQIVEGSVLGPKLVDHWPPSAAAQRNRGLDEVGLTAQWVMLIDDDVRVAPDCIEKLLSAVTRLGDRYIGFVLNPSDKEAFAKMGPLHSLRLVEWMGLYSGRMGAVSRSGWQTRIRHVDGDTDVEWAPTIAALWHTASIEGQRFDEFFEEYSYLEDLEFSYRIRALGKCTILSDVAYFHDASPAGRKSDYWFGRIEVKNRYYFVKKHGLSRPLFWTGISLRSAMTLLAALSGKKGQFQRFRGNLKGISQALSTRLKTQ